MLAWLRSFALFVLGATGLAGAVLVLTGRLDQDAARILGTAVILSTGALLTTLNAAAWGAKRARWIAGPGLAATFAGTLLGTLMIWVSFDADTMLRAVQVLICGAGFSHASALSLAKSAPSSAWVRGATILCTLLLTAVTSLMIGTDLGHEDVAFRVASALAVLTATGSVLTLLLHRIALLPEPKNWSVRAVCPRCREDLRLTSGANACGKCGLEMLVSFPGH